MTENSTTYASEDDSAAHLNSILELDGQQSYALFITPDHIEIRCSSFTVTQQCRQRWTDSEVQMLSPLP
jgi:hypothetical protein